MSQRFFVASPISGNRATLIESEAHHLIHVMRASVGDEVTLFDGSGCEFAARIESIGRGEVALTIIQRRAVDRELPLRLTLAVALPKGDRQQMLVEKATELGVTELVPLITQRGVAQPGEAARNRLRRAAIEAAKQCGRNRLMEIAPSAPWLDYAARLAEAKPQSFAARLMAHPGGQPLASNRQSMLHWPASASVVAAIGPEGGFTHEEVTLGTAAGWQLVDLGPRILRVETAVLAIAAWFSLSAPGSLNLAK